ncbi:MAG: BlaI/MecI/CopY family transcriptional regulator [Pyrinomonadaceae bacterium]
MKIPKFLLRGFSRPREAIISSLGKLERETMTEVWREKEVSVRQVFASFQERVAYTTVMTTLDRLYKKNLLNRRKEGKAYFYSPRFSLKELELGLTEDVIGSLLDAGTEHIQPVLACIVDAVSDRDRELLDELERMVQEKRRELENKV